MTSTKTQAVISSHDIAQHGLKENFGDGMPHLTAPIKQECSVERGIAGSGRQQGINPEHAIDYLS